MVVSSERSPMRFGGVEVRPAAREILLDGKTVSVGARAFDILVALIERNDRVVSKNELLDLVWPDVVVEENNLQVHISGLRKLLGPRVISTIPGRGYRFTGALESSTSAAPRSSAPASARAEGANPSRTNLPAELPVLYGRESEMSALRPLIRSSRLVTIVGAGGIGKSVLAQELAHELCGSFEGGVWWVELAPVADADRVATSAASVLHISLAAEEQNGALARALSNRQMLIVLDNCEHLLHSVAALVSAILRAAPQVRLLATSQEPLKVAQEHVYRLEALAVPSVASLESARQAGAVNLFEARVQAMSPSFVIGEHNVEAAIDICRHLDGIPLAIELAAARVPLLGVEGLRARLDQRLRVLAGGERLALPRHQKLRAAMEWSYGLLSLQEQTVFRRLGVFAGTFRLDSAQHVATEEGCDAWEALDHLGALVDKSLVVAELGELPRYRLLETSRAYAQELLLDAGEEPGTRRKHAEAMLGLFEQVHEKFWTGVSEPWRRLYGPDMENLRSALGWSADNDPPTAVALIGASSDLALALSLRQEWRRWFHLIEPRPRMGLEPRIEARYWLQRGILCLEWRNAEARGCADRAAALARASKDSVAEYIALAFAVMTRTSTLQEARRLLDRAASLERPKWPPRVLFQRTIAEISMLTEFLLLEEAATLAQTAIDRAKAMGPKAWVDVLRIRLADVYIALKDVKRAEALARDALGGDRPRGGVNLLHATATLTASLFLQERVAEGREAAKELIALSRNREWDLLHQFMDGCAFLAVLEGRPRAAARLLGYSDKVNALIGKRLLIQQIVREMVEKAIRGSFDAAHLASLLREGEALTDEAAVAITLSAQN